MAVGFLFLVQISASAAITIARPNYGVPELAETGGTFRVEIKASAGLSSNEWSAVLINDLRTMTGTVEQAEYGAYVDNDTVTGYRLTVRVPEGVSPEIFKLGISHTTGGTATNRHAVSVLRNFETNFYILHYTDIQVEGMEPTNPNTGQYNVKGSVREIYWHEPSISLINPRFMFNTGDEKENVWPGQTGYDLYLDAMCTIDVPVFVTRGNNDSTVSTAVWRSLIGVESHSLTMGSFYLCMKDYRQNNYLSWFTNQYAASFTNTAIKYRLFGQHFDSGATSWMPPAGQYPDLMLVGHGHGNSIHASTPYYRIMTAAAFNKGAVGFFNFAKSGGNWSCSNIGNQWFQLMSSGASAKVTNSFSVVNDGSQTTNQATIINNIAHNFYDGRLRFHMQYWPQGYEVTGGEKIAEYSYNGGTNMAVLVKVDIAASATTVVSINPFSAPGAPSVSNDGGASNVVQNAATLNGMLISTGGAPTGVWVYWGSTNGGQAKGSWESNEYFGISTTGILSTNVVNLAAATPYYYNFYASNAIGDAWAGISSNFTTVGSAASQDILVAAGSDDAKEWEDRSQTALTSSDLELVNYGVPRGLQTVGIRFNNLQIPQGAAITKAYIQFATDEMVNEAGSLTIRCQADDDPPTFTAAGSNITDRPLTLRAFSGWSPPAWNVEHEAGAAQQTPDLSAVIQEVVDRSGWTPGNSLVTVITGTGQRVAESFEGAAGHGDPSLAPRLHLEWDASLPRIWITSPTNAGTYSTYSTGVTLAGTATDSVGVTSVVYDVTGATVDSGSASTGPGDAWDVSGLVLNIGTSIVSVVADGASGHSATDTLEVVVLYDVDGDGMGDVWEIGNFGSVTNSDGGGDADGDRFMDLHEFLAGSDPTNSESLLVITNLVSEGVNAVIYWQSESNRFYSLLRSTNYFNTWMIPASNIIATPPMNVHTDALNNTDAGFYRIKLE